MILYSKDTKSDLSVNLWLYFSTQKCCPIVLLGREALVLNSKCNILQHFIIIPLNFLVRLDLLLGFLDA